jgi:hypothetical protein
MQPDLEKPGALAGATGPDTKSECAACRQYSILPLLSPLAHVPVFFRRFTVTGHTARPLSVLVKPDEHGRSMEHDIARFDWAAVRTVGANQRETVPPHIAGGRHAPR